MKIIVDMMGGDNAPLAVLEGAAQAVKEYGITVVGVGDEALVRRTAQENSIPLDGIELVNCTEVIDMCDEPARAIRQKKDSSIVVGLNMLKDGKGDAFVSAGSTGALHVGASLIVRTLKGIKRPALANMVPAKKQAYLLNHYLENFRTTLYRQTMFAEFEKIVHEKTQAGESLTMESLNQIYHDLNVLYYGPDMVVDSEIDYEWMRIPHFYNAFYVYQYATGFSAAVAFSKKILEEGEPAVDAYVNNFLCGGSSRDPMDLLAAAGVDMSTPEPVEEALTVFEECLDRFEKQMN